MIAMANVMHRKGKEEPFWHFCQNCDRWPTDDYEEKIDPERGIFCVTCVRLRREGLCPEGHESTISLDDKISFLWKF
jgi:hypothetical protein